MPAPISFNAFNTQGPQINSNCKSGPGTAHGCTNWSKVDGWSSVIASVPAALPIGCQRQCPPEDQLHGEWCQNCTHDLAITGLRYVRLLGLEFGFGFEFGLKSVRVWHLLPNLKSHCALHGMWCCRPMPPNVMT